MIREVNFINIHNVLYVFSEARFLELFEFIGKNVAPHVREEFMYTLSAFSDGFLGVIAEIGNFSAKTNIIALAMGISALIFITKKAFGWFKTMSK